MFIKDDNMKPFESKVWLSSPTMAWRRTEIYDRGL